MKEVVRFDLMIQLMILIITVNHNARDSIGSLSPLPSPNSLINSNHNDATSLRDIMICRCIYNIIVVVGVEIH